MSVVWPRLPHASANALYDEYSDLDLLELRQRSDRSHPDAAPIAVGGTAVDNDAITRLREGIRTLADDLGFPDALSRPAVARFDRPATTILHHGMDIVPADAASDEVWNFVSMVLLPDVAAWRFPDRARPRMLGHARNAFRRLWARADTIGADLVDVPGGLGEDEFVNIMERTSIAADRRVARSLARHVIECADLPVGRSEMMRDAAKRVLRQQALITLEILDDPEIDDLVRMSIEQAIRALTRPSASAPAPDANVLPPPPPAGDQPLPATVPPPPSNSKPPHSRPRQLRSAGDTTGDDASPPDRFAYQNDRGNDPWDHDAVCWLLENSEDARRWSYGVLFELLRRQPGQVSRDPDRVEEAAAVCRRFGVQQLEVVDPSVGKRIVRLRRTDASAPTYPAGRFDGD